MWLCMWSFQSIYQNIICPKLTAVALGFFSHPFCPGLQSFVCLIISSFAATVMDRWWEMEMFSSVSVCWIDSSMHGVLPSDLGQIVFPSAFPIPARYSLSSFPSDSSSFSWCIAEAHHPDRSVGYVKVMPSWLQPLSDAFQRQQGWISCVDMEALWLDVFFVSENQAVKYQKSSGVCMWVYEAAVFMHLV